MRARFAFFAVVTAFAGLNALIAWWSPIIDGDWLHQIWAAHHPGAGVGTVLADHARFPDFVAYVLARSQVVHVIVTPLVVLALLAGAFTLLRRRLPSPDRAEDLLDLAVLSALIWIALPNAGLAYFYRPYLAREVYAATLAVWFLAPYLCRWQVRPYAVAPLALAGLLACSATPQLALVVVVVCGVKVWRGPRRPWMVIGLAAALAGACLAFSQPPKIDAARVVGRSLETNLDRLGMPIGECGQAIAVVAVLALITALLAKLSRAAFAPTDDDRPELVAVWTYAGLWLALIVGTLFGPTYDEATLFAPSLALSIACVPYIRVIARTKWMRVVVTAFVAGIHAIVWMGAITTYGDIHEQFADRIARIAAAPPASVATVAPYSPVYRTYYFVGEDWSESSDRELVARELFGLRDIDISPAFRTLDQSPGISLRLETTSPVAQPAWARSLSVAHVQFAHVVDSLPAGNTARLVVDNFDFPERHARPVLAAWVDADGTINEDVIHTSPDPEDRSSVLLPPAYVQRFTEAWIVHDGEASSVNVEDRVRFRAATAGRWATVLCDSRLCLLADAFVPRF